MQNNILHSITYRRPRSKGHLGSSIVNTHSDTIYSMKSILLFCTKEEKDRQLFNDPIVRIMLRNFIGRRKYHNDTLVSTCRRFFIRHKTSRKYLLDTSMLYCQYAIKTSVYAVQNYIDFLYNDVGLCVFVCRIQTSETLYTATGRSIYSDVSYCYFPTNRKRRTVFENCSRRSISMSSQVKKYTFLRSRLEKLKIDSNSRFFKNDAIAVHTQESRDEICDLNLLTYGLTGSCVGSADKRSSVRKLSHVGEICHQCNSTKTCLSNNAKPYRCSIFIKQKNYSNSVLSRSIY